MATFTHDAPPLCDQGGLATDQSTHPPCHAKHHVPYLVREGVKCLVLRRGCGNAEGGPVLPPVWGMEGGGEGRREARREGLE